MFYLLASQSLFLSHFIIPVFPLKMVISLYFFPNKSIFSSRSFFAALLSTLLEQQSWMKKNYVQQQGVWSHSALTLTTSNNINILWFHNKNTQSEVP